MTWGGTKKKFREIVTLETGDFFWCFLDPLKAGGGGTLSKKFSKIIFLSSPWVAVLKL
jgi:hypothetical protein